MTGQLKLPNKPNFQLKSPIDCHFTPNGCIQVVSAFKDQSHRITPSHRHLDDCLCSIWIENRGFCSETRCRHSVAINKAYFELETPVSLMNKVALGFLCEI
jgi:hypothetical protein